MICPICKTDLTNLPQEERLAHLRACRERYAIEHKDEIDAMLRRSKFIDKAVGEIHRKHGQKPGREVCDTMPCPACEGGVLYYIVSGYNGHIRAQCDNCELRWMS